MLKCVGFDNVLGFLSLPSVIMKRFIRALILYVSINIEIFNVIDLKRRVFKDLSVSLLYNCLVFDGDSRRFSSMNFSVFQRFYLCYRIYRVHIHIFLTRSIFAMLFT